MPEILVEKTKMKNLILLLIASMFCVFPLFGQPHLTDPSLTTAKKTRVIKIYLYRQADENRPLIDGKLVPVKRRIFDYEPLYGAMQSLRAGEIESDNTGGWYRTVG